jgi:predicted metal-dependent phosphoesterase TrpH
MTEKADLHVRTTTSGGKLSPAAALGLAKEKGLKAIAIVEHDTLESLPEVAGLSKMMNIEAIPGVELIYEEEAREAHIIG